jgi:hypothetical protein
MLSVALLAGVPAVSVVMAQEVTVEDSYLQTTQNIMVIDEFSNSSDREHKMTAVRSIEELLKKGERPDEARAILARLSLEGTLNKDINNGRVMNNFPEVRERAARDLGDFPGPEAVKALGQIIINEKESAVLSAAIDSLTKLSAFDNETLNIVQFILYQYNALANDSRLANSLLNYYDKCPPKAAVMSALSTIRDNPRYVSTIKHRAEQIFKRKGNRP